MKKSVMMITALLLAAAIPALAQTGHWSEPVLVTELNTPESELFTYLSADGSTIVWNATGTLCMSRWLGHRWSPKELLPSPINDPQGLERAIAITPDLQWIYWVSWRAGGMGSWDIWRSHWDDSSQTWGPAELLGPNINSPTIEWALCFTADGRRMYFSTDDLEKNGQYGFGFMDIWYVDWDTTINDWGDPFHLGSPINRGASDDEISFISHDSETMYFSCHGAHGVPGWQGGYDIFKATWIDSTSSWENVENLLPPICSPKDELDACVTPDHTKMYFCRRRTVEPITDHEIMVSQWVPSGIEDRGGYDDGDFQLMVFPNPANKGIEIIIYGANDAAYMLRIINIGGQEVRRYELNYDNRIFWDGRDWQGAELATGIYYITAFFASGKTITRASTLIK